MLLENKVKEMSLSEIRLGVLKHNIGARKLYEKVGYHVFKQREYDCVIQKII